MLYSSRISDDYIKYVRILNCSINPNISYRCHVGILKINEWSNCTRCNCSIFHLYLYLTYIINCGLFVAMKLYNCIEELTLYTAVYSVVWRTVIQGTKNRLFYPVFRCLTTKKSVVF